MAPPALGAPGLEESNFLRKESNCAVGESNYRVIWWHVEDLGRRRTDNRPLFPKEYLHNDWLNVLVG
jgi:hypothetical protein